MTKPLFTTLDLPKPEGAYFDDEEATKAVRFFSLLTHTKGRWAGKQFVLQPWQEQFVRAIFGWKREDGTRLYRTVYAELPRKSGKSTIAAALAGKLLYADGEAGAEVYSAASDREQARIVFEQLKQMVVNSPELRSRSTIHRNAISVDKTASTYKVLSSDVSNKWGYNLSGLIFDELHAQPNRELWDALTTSVGARTQPLTIAISTAGFDKNSICYELREYTERLSKGIIEDPSFLGLIYSAAEDDDWTDPEVWARANPNLGVTVLPEYLESECQKALAMPAFQNSFKRLFLCQWVSQETRVLDMKAWDDNALDFTADDLLGKPCIGGLDIGSTTDMTAFVLVFPESDGSYKVLPHYFIPKENIRERALRDRVPYEVWERQHLVTATNGQVVDFNHIKEAIRQAAERYDLRAVVFDRWESQALVNDLREDGLAMFPLGQGFSSMSAPTKEMLRLVLERKFNHNGHAVLRWNADNAAAKTDPAGNIKLDKSKSTARIDGLVAAVMALDGALRRDLEPKDSVYEDRGLAVF